MLIFTISKYLNRILSSIFISFVVFELTFFTSSFPHIKLTFFSERIMEKKANLKRYKAHYEQNHITHYSMQWCFNRIHYSTLCNILFSCQVEFSVQDLFYSYIHEVNCHSFKLSQLYQYTDRNNEEQESVNETKYGSKMSEYTDDGIRWQMEINIS